MVHQVNPIRLKCGNSALLFLITGLITLLHGSHSCEGQTVNDQYGLAAGYYARGEYVEAITAFQTIIQRHPNTELAAVSHFFLPSPTSREKTTPRPILPTRRSWC